ncbi:hypothetical protein KDK77_08960, partial [bacterium]|nr:hypothetical protein [bacterium]
HLGKTEKFDSIQESLTAIRRIFPVLANNMVQRGDFEMVFQLTNALNTAESSLPTIELESADGLKASEIRSILSGYKRILNLLVNTNIADIGLQASPHVVVNQRIRQAFSSEDGYEYKGVVHGKKVYVLKGLDTIDGRQRGHAGLALNSIYIAENAYSEELVMHEIAELNLWQKKALALYNDDSDNVRSGRIIDINKTWDEDMPNSLTQQEREQIRDFLRNKWIPENLDVAIQRAREFHDEANRLSPVQPNAEVIDDKIILRDAIQELFRDKNRPFEDLLSFGAARFGAQPIESLPLTEWIDPGLLSWFKMLNQGRSPAVLVSVETTDTTAARDQEIQRLTAQLDQIPDDEYVALMIFTNQNGKKNHRIFIDRAGYIKENGVFSFYYPGIMRSMYGSSINISEFYLDFSYNPQAQAIHLDVMNVGREYSNTLQGKGLAERTFQNIVTIVRNYYPGMIVADAISGRVSQWLREYFDTKKATKQDYDERIAPVFGQYTFDPILEDNLPAIPIPTPLPSDGLVIGTIAPLTPAETARQPLARIVSNQGETFVFLEQLAHRDRAVYAGLASGEVFAVSASEAAHQLTKLRLFRLYGSQVLGLDYVQIASNDLARWVMDNFNADGSVNPVFSQLNEQIERLAQQAQQAIAQTGLDTVDPAELSLTQIDQISDAVNTVIAQSEFSQLYGMPSVISPQQLDTAISDLIMMPDTQPDQKLLHILGILHPLRIQHQFDDNAEDIILLLKDLYTLQYSTRGQFVNIRSELAWWAENSVNERVLQYAQALFRNFDQTLQRFAGFTLDAAKIKDGHNVSQSPYTTDYFVESMIVDSVTGQPVNRDEVTKEQIDAGQYTVESLSIGQEIFSDLQQILSKTDSIPRNLFVLHGISVTPEQIEEVRVRFLGQGSYKEAHQIDVDITGVGTRSFVILKHQLSSPSDTFSGNALQREMQTFALLNPVDRETITPQLGQIVSNSQLRQQVPDLKVTAYFNTVSLAQGEEALTRDGLKGYLIQRGKESDADYVKRMDAAIAAIAAIYHQTYINSDQQWINGDLNFENIFLGEQAGRTHAQIIDMGERALIRAAFDPLVFMIILVQDGIANDLSGKSKELYSKNFTLDRVLDRIVEAILDQGIVSGTQYLARAQQQLSAFLESTRDTNFNYRVGYFELNVKELITLNQYLKSVLRNQRFVTAIDTWNVDQSIAGENVVLEGVANTALDEQIQTEFGVQETIVSPQPPITFNTGDSTSDENMTAVLSSQFNPFFFQQLGVDANQVRAGPRIVLPDSPLPVSIFYSDSIGDSDMALFAGIAANSILAVDVPTMAVQLAKLRLWQLFAGNFLTLSPDQIAQGELDNWFKNNIGVDGLQSPFLKAVSNTIDSIAQTAVQKIA